jgi:hypothetical protein
MGMVGRNITFARGKLGDKNIAQIKLHFLIPTLGSQ